MVFLRFCKINSKKMSTLSGIDFETDTVTKKRYVRIDFDRYGKAIMPFFEQIGVINRNDDFWKEYAAGVTGEIINEGCNSNCP